MSFEVQCSRLFDTVCVYKESHLETLAVKEIHTTENCHSITAIPNSYVCCCTTTACVLCTFPLDWDDVIQDDGVIRHHVIEGYYTFIYSVRMTQVDRRKRLSHIFFYKDSRVKRVCKLKVN